MDVELIQDTHNVMTFHLIVKESDFWAEYNRLHESDPATYPAIVAPPITIQTISQAMNVFNLMRHIVETKLQDVLRETEAYEWASSQSRVDDAYFEMDDSTTYNPTIKVGRTVTFLEKKDARYFKLRFIP